MNDCISRAVNNIFRTNLGVKPSNRVLVFTDAYSRSLKKTAKRVALAGEKFTNRLRYVESTPTGCHGVEPPEELWVEAYGSSAGT